MSESKVICEEKLLSLRERAASFMDGKRYSHTLGVERESIALARLFMPKEEYRLRIAALLHDITKQLPKEKQLKICEEFGIIVGKELLASPKLFHAQTGAAVAGRDFPEYADETVLRAIRYHTTGRAGMSLFESLIYLADYIEDTRTFADCVKLREFFYSEIEKAGSDAEKREALRKTMILSFDMTMKNLMEENAPIDRDTVEARNYFICNESCFE